MYEKIYECPQYFKRCGNARALKIHMKTHEKPESKSGSLLKFIKRTVVKMSPKPNPKKKTPVELKPIPALKIPKRQEPRAVPMKKLPRKRPRDSDLSPKHPGKPPRKLKPNKAKPSNIPSRA